MVVLYGPLPLLYQWAQVLHPPYMPWLFSLNCVSYTYTYTLASGLGTYDLFLDVGPPCTHVLAARSFFTLEDEEEPFPHQLVRLSADGGSADEQLQLQEGPRGDTTACGCSVAVNGTGADGLGCCLGSTAGHGVAILTSAPTPTVNARVDHYYSLSEPGGEPPSPATAGASKSSSSSSSRLASVSRTSSSGIRTSSYSSNTATTTVTATATSAWGGLPSFWPMLATRPARPRGAAGGGPRPTAGQHPDLPTPAPAPLPTAKLPVSPPTPSSAHHATPRPPLPVAACAGHREHPQPSEPGKRGSECPGPTPTPAPAGAVPTPCALPSPSLLPVHTCCGGSSSSMSSEGCCGRALHRSDVREADALGQCAPGSNARDMCHSGGSSSMPCRCSRVGGDDDAWEADARRQLEALRALRLSLRERLSRLAAPSSLKAESVNGICKSNAISDWSSNALAR